MTFFLMILIYSSAWAAGADIVIGYVGERTSQDLANESRQALNTLNMIISERNNQVRTHRPKIVVKEFDTQGDPSRAYSLKDEIRDSHLTAVVGFHNSADAIVLLPELDKMKIPTIVIGATSDLVLSHKHYAVQMLNSDSSQSIALAEKLIEIGRTRVSLAVDIANPSELSGSRTFSTHFQSLGGKVIGKPYEIDPQNIKFSDIAKKLSRDPSTLVIFGLTLDIIYLSEMLRSEHKEMEIITSGGILYSDLSLAMTDVKDHFNVKLFVSYWDMIGKEKDGNKFFSQYKRLYSEKLSPFCIDAITMNDAAHILLKAIDTASSLSPDTLINAIKDTHSDGLTGRMSFHHNGHPKKQNLFGSIQKGVFHNAN